MNPILRQIADFMSKRQSSAAIDPIEIRPSLLPYLYILEVETDATGRRRLRVRLTGTAIDRTFGRSLRGAHLDDFLHGPRSSDVLNGFLACAEHHTPIWMRQVVELHDKPPRYVEGIAYFMEPNLIYGGLMLGEVPGEDVGPSFESLAI
ncbi:MAG: PAS domain-containing protein [Proteobacteria bacterium]|nr:PAS domain-containing protein [Pseudomonadota bacterium]